MDSREDALVFGRIITLKDTWGKQGAGTEQKAEGKKRPSTKGRGPDEVRGEGSSSPAKAHAPKAQPLTPEQEAEFTRLVSLGASEGDARTIARDEALLKFVEGAAQDDTFGQVASLTVNDLATGLRAGTAKVQAADLAPLARELAGGKLTTRVARDALGRAAASGEAPLSIIEREGLNAGLSAEDLQRAIADVLAANPDKVEAYRGGKTALLGFFTGQVMRATGGKAEPGALAGALKAALEG